MIEVEKKFLVNRHTFSKIIGKLKPISQQRLVDVYYDTSDFKLTTQDWWLRNRNSKFELKLPVLGSKSAVDQYHEIIEDKEICQCLGITCQGLLSSALKQNDISPFATIISKRKKYKKDNFTIDFDVTDFNYSICEVEIMVNHKSEIEQALEKIDIFRKDNNLNDKPIRGKLVEYIYRNNPRHYQALRVAGIIRD